jgi:hypothetical protein
MSRKKKKQRKVAVTNSQFVDRRLLPESNGVQAKELKFKREHRRDTLVFTWEAWAHWHWLCQHADIEVTARGETSVDAPLYVERLHVPLQQGTTVHTYPCPKDIDRIRSAQLPHKPAWLFDRIWLHTHPGNSATPSSTDEETLQAAFGTCPYSVMAILAKGGQRSCRLTFAAAGGSSKEIAIAVDQETILEFMPRAAELYQQWLEEFNAKVSRYVEPPRARLHPSITVDDDWWRKYEDLRERWQNDVDRSHMQAHRPIQPVTSSAPVVRTPVVQKSAPASVPGYLFNPYQTVVDPGYHYTDDAAQPEADQTVTSADVIVETDLDRPLYDFRTGD